MTTGRQISEVNLEKISLNILRSGVSIDGSMQVCANYQAVKNQILFSNSVERLQFQFSVNNRVFCREKKTVPLTKCTVVMLRVVTDYVRGTTVTAKTPR
jgi:hypothetical protein